MGREIYSFAMMVLYMADQIILMISDSLVKTDFPENLYYSKFKNQPQKNRSLGTINLKHCKITCRAELDTGPSTTDSAVEFHSTMD